LPSERRFSLPQPGYLHSPERARRQYLAFAANSSTSDGMRQRSAIGTTRLVCAFGLALLLCASKAAAASAINPDLIGPAVSETPISDYNSTQNILDFDDQHDSKFVARQASCPDSSTDQLCELGFCFLSQDNGDSSWGTCCPAGWSLWLNSAEWSSQKCCPPDTSSDQCASDGESEAPLQPVGCGSGGVISGWACVYSDESSAGVRATCPTLVVMALGLSWTLLGL